MLSFLSLSNLSFEKHGPCEITSLGDTQQVETLLIAVTLLSSHCDYFSVIFYPCHGDYCYNVYAANIHPLRGVCKFNHTQQTHY